MLFRSASHIRVASPHPYIDGDDADLNRDLIEKMQPHLVVGSLWTIEVPMSPDNRFTGPDYVQHEFKYIQPNGYFFAEDKYPPGTVAVYLGTTRVEEGRFGSLLRVPRHTFLIEGIRYMTASLRHFSPVN